MSTTIKTKPGMLYKWTGPKMNSDYLLIFKDRTLVVPNQEWNSKPYWTNARYTELCEGWIEYPEELENFKINLL